MTGKKDRDYRLEISHKIRLMVIKWCYREPEVKAVMDWMRKNDFILSASFHDG